MGFVGLVSFAFPLPLEDCDWECGDLNLGLGDTRAGMVKRCCGTEERMSFWSS